ncbi:MAG: D-alanyl-D-alanine carboxypeptidase [Clostridia bacterium]|nr:D-alanyl-D-alanine carboxypeptidase [Clostridia bacterium]
MSKRFITVFLSFAVVFLLFCSSSKALAAENINVSAESAVLIEVSGGRVVYEKNAYCRMPMASTTKIMTALVAIEEGDLDRIVTVSDKAVGVEGSSIYLYPGEKLSMRDLIYALMLESANDAAAAIAIAVAGSVEGFARLMNLKADEIGLADTHFENPHGLDSEQHYTTAYDLACLAAYALRNESFREIVSTYRRVIPLQDNEGSRVLLNHNRLLRSYDGAIGVKTGFTKKSGRCLVSSAERDGVTLVSVTLNAPDDWNDHKEMLDLGFRLFEKLNLSRAREERFELLAVNGEKSSFLASNSADLSVITEKKDRNIRKVVELKRFYYAPIASGEVVGRICYYDGECFLGAVDITAEEGVAAVKKMNFWEYILSLFRR